MPASEYLYWQAYFKIFPFSEDRADERAAMLATTIANALGNPKRPARMEMFMPDYLRPFQKRTKAPASLQQQRREWDAFKAKYKAAEQAARGQKP